MSTVAFIRRLMAKGMDIETSLQAAEEFEAQAPALTPALSPRQERNRRYYEAKRLKASESKTTKTELDVSVKLKTVSDVSVAEPRPHVRDITSTSENNHNYTLPENRDPICDWPEGKAHHHAEMIVADMASPWLDLQKSPGLVTTAGRLAAWKRDGASWEHDVLPLIRGRLMNRRSPVTTWAFFDAAIGETVALNRAALAIPEAGTVIPFRQVGPPISRDEKISNTWDMTIEKFERDEQSQN